MASWASFRLFDGKVAYADVSYLSLFHQIFHRLHCFFDRDAWIRPVDHVKIDYLGIEPAQTAFGRLDHIVVMQMLGRNLGRQKDFASDVSDGFSDNSLGPIHLCCIHVSCAERDSELQWLDSTAVRPGSLPDFRES